MVQDQTLGAYLSQVREDRGYSSPEAAARAAERRGMSVNGKTIRNIEEDKVKRPDADTLQILAKLYGLDYRDLLRRAGYPEAMAGDAEAKVSPRLAQVVTELGLSLDAQDRIAAALPQLMALAQVMAGAARPAPTPLESERAALQDRITGMLARMRTEDLLRTVMEWEEKMALDHRTLDPPLPEVPLRKTPIA